MMKAALFALAGTAAAFTVVPEQSMCVPSARPAPLRPSPRAARRAKPLLTSRPPPGIPPCRSQGPFTSFDNEGFRVYPGWRLAGSASLQENFLRLTNDRQSKRASVWSTSRMGLEEWSTTLRFRVSGQGKRLFGDGLALVSDRAARARAPGGRQGGRN